MSLRDELLIPFRGIGGAGRDLVAGSLVLCRCGGRAARRGLAMGWARATAGKTRADQLESLGIAAFAGMVGGVVGVLAVRQLLHLVVPYAVPIGWSAGGMWVLAAWVVAPAGTPREKIVSLGGEAPPPAPAPDVEPLTVAAVARAVRAVAVPNAWLGAHLDDILAHLPGHSRGQLLSVLAEAGIPVTEQLKLRRPGEKQRNRQGVRLDALPQGLVEAPPTPAPGPPQPAPEVPAQPPPRVPHLTVHRGE